MPKMKTNKSAKGGFKITGTGRILRAAAGKGHLRRRKSKRLKRRLDKWQPLAAGDLKRVQRSLPNGLK